MVSIVRTTPLTCGCQASVTMRIFADMSVYLFLRANFPVQVGESAGFLCAESVGGSLLKVGMIHDINL